MKEKDKINLINFLMKYIKYKDGFWILEDKIVSEDEIRDFINKQGFSVLEKDITDILSELSYKKCDFGKIYDCGRICKIRVPKLHSHRFFYSSKSNPRAI